MYLKYGAVYNFQKWYIGNEHFQCCPLSQVYFPVHIHPVMTLGSILWNIALREYTVQYCPLWKGNTLTCMTIHKWFLHIPKNYILSVLGLDSGYTAKYRPSPLGVSSGEGLYLTMYPSSCPNTDTIFIRPGVSRAVLWTALLWNLWKNYIAKQF